MTRRVHTSRRCLLVLLLCVACREDPQLPPDPDGTPKPVTVEVAQRHVGQVRADKLITVTNLVFVLQHDRAYPSQMALTLKTTHPGPDGSRMLFYKFVPSASLEKLAESEIYLVGGRRYDRAGPGVFTATSAYQPKFASLKITAYTDDEVRGTLSGEFYKFNPLQPTLRPDVINVEITFAAALVVN